MTRVLYPYLMAWTPYTAEVLLAPLSFQLCLAVAGKSCWMFSKKKTNALHS